MDPVFGTVLVALIGTVGAIGTAILTGRGNADRLRQDDIERRLRRRIEDLGGDHDDIE